MREGAILRKLSWILLALAGASTLLVSLISANLAYSGKDYPIGEVAVAEVAQGRPGLESALRGLRGTAAGYAGAYALLFLCVVLGPYRRGEVWSWWALLAATLALVAYTAARVPLLGIRAGVGPPLVLGGVVLVALLLDVGRVRGTA